MTRNAVPDLMPVLSPGRHRNPGKGACFMEMASYLAGEPWSDHPDCTHPVLAALAREVNDRIGDVRRQDLAPLIPDVIGIHGTDPSFAWRIAWHCALAALPAADSARRRVTALSLLVCARNLRLLEDRPPGWKDTRVLTVVAQAPDEAAWATDFMDRHEGCVPASLGDDDATLVIAQTVRTIAEGAGDREDDLVRLLRSAIASARAWESQPASRDAATNAPVASASS